MDKMMLKNMRFFGYHGVFPEENRLGQQYIVSVELKIDLSQAAQTDDLSYTVNYAEIHALVKVIVEGPPYKLIEALAGHIASGVLEAYTSVNEVTVFVTKPNPPFDIHFDGVTVELCRKRDEHEPQ
ncbi:dihydroneopterin aldolase [Paenibacillus baekrokdamisoli]|uniref:7,8-dihydroneopterin aldolase n=1 Tax=Paenibacillus baekrokdamisoli TaxID=1712516 RepID=A0A3G9JJZ9_9BACL|nr:dihydroneopterin aldolase [Paenibacillus baekrokdamisoli]MBB3073020.1 dihydroneopterin aldolase [Paenibacillus baekrokdamisoli]BBH23314.1 dihydroneopterin aldolase [Paenibacillus baekrokdamisoli]